MFKPLIKENPDVPTVVTDERKSHLIGASADHMDKSTISLIRSHEPLNVRSAAAGRSSCDGESENADILSAMANENLCHL